VAFLLQHLGASINHECLRNIPKGHGFARPPCGKLHRILERAKHALGMSAFRNERGHIALAKVMMVRKAYVTDELHTLCDDLPFKSIGIGNRGREQKATTGEPPGLVLLLGVFRNIR